MNRGRSGWANAVLSPQWDLNLTRSILYSKCIVPNLVSYSTTREQEKLLRKAPSPILERWWWKLLMGWMWKAEMQRAGRQWDSSDSRADSISVSSLDSKLWFHKWLTQTRHPQAQSPAVMRSQDVQKGQLLLWALQPSGINLPLPISLQFPPLSRPWLSPVNSSRRCTTFYFYSLTCDLRLNPHHCMLAPAPLTESLLFTSPLIKQRKSKLYVYLIK